MECLAIGSIRHLVNLQWNLKVRDILPGLTSHQGDNLSEVPETIIRRAICRPKGMEDLIFHLELTSQLNVLAEGKLRCSYRIIHAFAVIKDRAFLLMNCDKLKFLNFLKVDHLDLADEIALHCMVLVIPPAADLASTESFMADIKEELPTDGQIHADFEGIVHPHCKFDGEIPDFSVDKAKELLSDEGTNSVLKVLALEYLIENIKVKNVTDILKISIDQDLKVLQKHCFEFLRKCTIQNDNFSSSATSDDDYELND